MPFLTSIAVIPLLGAALVAALPRRAARLVSLGTAVFALALAVCVAAQFEPGAGLQFVEEVPWIPSVGAYYALAVDGLGLSMVLLTTVLTIFVLAYSFTERFSAESLGEKAFLALVLAVEGFSLFVFMVTDVLLFYVFFEAALLPMFFLIAGFGGKDRTRAALTFLLYSLGSGLLMLAAIIGLWVATATPEQSGTFLLSEIVARGPIDEATARWLFAGFMIAFAVKAPMVPLHTWLPSAAANTTPGGAVMMVAIMDKFGTFGMLRFAIGLFPEAATWAADFIMFFAVLSIVWGALGALSQTHLIRLVAYTSVSHFGFIVLGLFAFTDTALAGAALYMVNHGLSTALLFLVVGYLVRRRGTAEIDAFGGVQRVAPVLAGYLLIAGLAALGLPGLAPFISEFAVLAGTFAVAPWFAGCAATGLVLAACYVMRMYRRTATGTPGAAVRRHVTDLTMGERVVLFPLIVMLLVFGFYPAPLTTVLNPDAAEQAAAVAAASPAASVDNGGNAR